LLRRWLDWQLQRNPIGWLEQRCWSGRLVVWSWFAIVICIYSSLFANLSLYQRGFRSLQTFLASLLAGSIALSAAGSFRRERESGVLELLVVSPIREWQIIAGRVRGLWMQFLPAMLLLCVVWLYCSTFLSEENELFSVLIYGVAFATLPVIGLYFSLAKNNFIAALVWTLLVGIALPNGMARIIALCFEPSNSTTILVQEFLPCVIQVALAVLCAGRLHHHLRYRKFALDRKGA
jgi:ABC-type transport system involved in multi-copper enzyme maturation permease subunit